MNDKIEIPFSKFFSLAIITKSRKKILEKPRYMDDQQKMYHAGFADGMDYATKYLLKGVIK